MFLCALVPIKIGPCFKNYCFELWTQILENYFNKTGFMTTGLFIVVFKNTFATRWQTMSTGLN